MSTEDDQRIADLATETRLVQDLQRLGVRGARVGVDTGLLISFDGIARLLDARKETERRTRPRDVLVGQLTSLFATAIPDPAGVDEQSARAFRETLAERVIDTLGVAVLATGEARSTDRTVGEVEEISIEEFAERTGRPVHDGRSA